MTQLVKLLRLSGLVVVFILAGCLTGCGQKGPLFLPGQNPNPPTPLLDDDEAVSQPVEAKTADEPSDTPGESGRATGDTDTNAN